MKRFVDLALTIGAAPVWVPVVVVVAVAVRIRLGSPIFFKQLRPGLDGRPFVIVKFRTMRDAATGDGPRLSDAERMTPFGRLLRRTSLDELPELWNVLMGDMSLVGPRPLLIEYLPRYSPTQARRHEVRPGVTGWAQVNGRNALGWDEKFKLDVWYVDHRSLALDFKILLATFGRVLMRDGISPTDQEVMPIFSGLSSDERTPVAMKPK